MLYKGRTLTPPRQTGRNGKAVREGRGVGSLLPALRSMTFSHPPKQDLSFVWIHWRSSTLSFPNTRLQYPLKQGSKFMNLMMVILVMKQKFFYYFSASVFSSSIPESWEGRQVKVERSGSWTAKERRAWVVMVCALHLCSSVGLLLPE